MALIATYPPRLYDALKAEGFHLPDECGDVQMTMPVDGLFQLHYTINLTADDLERIGKAFVRLVAEGKIDKGFAGLRAEEKR